MSILDRIMEDKRAEVDALRGARPLAELEAEVTDAPPTRPFADALRCPGGAFSIIAEVKKASPSKGLIREDFDPVYSNLQLKSLILAQIERWRHA